MLFCVLPPLLMFLMILRCFDCYEINSEHVLKQKGNTKHTFQHFNGNAIPRALHLEPKRLRGVAKLEGALQILTFQTCCGFCNPSLRFEVFRQGIFMFWALILRKVMISSRNVTFFAYKHKPVLNPKREVRKCH